MAQDVLKSDDASPGPWTVQKNGIGQVQRIIDANDEFVADLQSPAVRVFRPEALANAQLISASPDLRDALTLARPILVSWRDTFLDTPDPETPAWIEDVQALMSCVLAIDAALEKAGAA